MTCLNTSHSNFQLFSILFISVNCILLPFRTTLLELLIVNIQLCWKHLSCKVLVKNFNELNKIIIIIIKNILLLVLLLLLLLLTTSQNI